MRVATYNQIRGSPVGNVPGSCNESNHCIGSSIERVNEMMHAYIVS